jgi:hypothetical protein
MEARDHFCKRILGIAHSPLDGDDGPYRTRFFDVDAKHRHRTGPAPSIFNHQGGSRRIDRGSPTHQHILKRKISAGAKPELRDAGGDSDSGVLLIDEYDLIVRGIAGIIDNRQLIVRGLISTVMVGEKIEQDPADGTIIPAV